MNRVRTAVACIFALIVANPAQAADWQLLEGSYAITADSYLDPPAGEPKDSHVRFQLTGKTARDLFHAMKVTERMDECTGAVERSVGHMRCLFFATQKNYECAFSIEIMQQKIDYGVVC